MAIWQLVFLFSWVPRKKNTLQFYKITGSGAQQTEKLQSQKTRGIQPQNYTVLFNGETHSA